MTREPLEHVLRAAAAAAVANENSLVVVVGSQATLLPFPDAPAALLVSREIDLYPALHPERSDLIDSAMSSFDERCLDPARAPIASVLAWAQRRAIEAST